MANPAYIGFGWRCRSIVLLAAVCAALADARPAAAQSPLVVDLSQHIIEIDSRFTGADVLLFGARDGPGDVIVVLRGPESAEVVRRKEPIAGIWLNNRQVTFLQVPGYFAVAASRPLEEIGSPEMYEVNQIGRQNLRLRPSAKVDPITLDQFRDALLRLQANAGLIPDAVGAVGFIGDKLFRATFKFPANVPTGRYQAVVYLVENGMLVSKQTTELEVAKSGFEAVVHGIAEREPLTYGFLAVSMALAAGWLGAVFFGRT